VKDLILQNFILFHMLLLLFFKDRINSEHVEMWKLCQVILMELSICTRIRAVRPLRRFAANEYDGRLKTGDFLLLDRDIMMRTQNPCLNSIGCFES